MKKILFIAFVMLLSTTVVKAQEEKKEGKEKIYLKLKEGAKPTIYVNDKLFDFPMELIDQSKIVSVSVLKDEQAIKKYNAPNGVILINTNEIKMKIKTKGFESRFVPRSTTFVPGSKTVVKSVLVKDKDAPMVIIDGKITDRRVAEEIDPKTIDSITILKDSVAIKKYNAPNGVIIVTLKKK